MIVTQDMDIFGSCWRRQADVETMVLNRMMRQQLHKAIRDPQEEEQYLIIQLFFLERSERELVAEPGISQKAVNKRRACTSIGRMRCLWRGLIWLR